MVGQRPVVARQRWCYGGGSLGEPAPDRAEQLLAAPLDPPMPARADAVEVIAPRLGAVEVKVDADQSTPTRPDASDAHVRGAVG